ncbi:unnamed protein product [Auanema sp. JU1783]|nr:unnamed protein product [Auanema sp. JU1783]
MDRKLKSDEQWFISPKIILKDFLEEAWQADLNLRNSLGRQALNVLVKEEEYHPIQLQHDFAKYTGCSDKAAKLIFESNISIDNLLDGDTTTKSYDDDMQEDIQANLRPDKIRVHSYVANHWKTMQNPQKKSNYLRTMKYDKYEDYAAGLRREMPVFNHLCSKDIVITVSALVPNNKILSHAESRSSRIMQPSSKFILRGDSTLESLKKQLKCVSDMIVPLEEGKELEPYDMQYSTMMQYPSSFIFIDDCFYVDLSNPACEDISEPIREFMARKKCFDKVTHKPMAGVKIIDLKLRLGQPYVFQHSGTCEHLLIFHDLRLLHKSDEQDINKYPLLAYEKGGDARCAGCKQNYATYRVEECERLPAPSVLFCDECFAEFNFSHGVKIGSFRAYPYYQINRILFV